MSYKLFSLNKDGSYNVWDGGCNSSGFTVQYGKENGKMQERFTKTEPKNVGKKNETDPLEQAEKELSSKWAKQFDKGYRSTKEAAYIAAFRLPMLAHDYLKKSHLINFPCYVSRKLDGLRVFAKVDTKAKTVKLTSRMGKPYLCPEQIKEEMLKLSALTGIDTFDGELYKHGVPLQHITGAAKKPRPLTTELEYHIFDLPIQNMAFNNRETELCDVIDACDGHEFEYVYCLEYEIAQDEECARKYMDIYIQEGYEGIMLRNSGGMYEFGNRSNDLQKWKDFKDMEVKILSVREDKNGEGVYNCKLVNDKEVECKMVGSFETRNYGACKKNIGRWITLKYQTLTEGGKPQFPVGMCFRECDSKGNPLD